MAKMFFKAQEAASRLNMSEKELKDLVREGKLREFRDAGNINYKVDEVEKLAASGVTGSGGGAAPAEELDPMDEIVLEPAEPEPSLEESGVELAPASSDVLSLDEVDSDGTHAGSKEGTAAKEGSVVSSVGVSVFDDDELDEIVDPLAQTQVSDAGALGIEGVGSGSGILDLTRERDDTSLGAELLDEIYTGEEESGVEMGDDTRTGLEGVEAEEEGEEEEAFSKTPAGTAPAAGKQAATVRQVVEYGPDPVSSALTAMMAVAVVVMLFAGLGAAALVQGVKPAILATINDNMLYFGGGSLLLVIIAAVVAFLLAKRSS